MGRSPYWEANNHASSQEISHISLQCSQIPPQVPILSQMNPILEYIL